MKELFKEGQKAYSVKLCRGSMHTSETKEVRVDTVGDKSVRAGSVYGAVIPYEECGEESALRGRDDHNLYLCPTKEAADKLIEKDDLKRYISGLNGFDDRYSYEQMRAVKQIMDPEDGERPAITEALPSSDRAELFGCLVDIVEDWLDEKGITPDDIPNEEREGTEDGAIIFGKDFDALADRFAIALGIRRYAD